MKHSRLVSSLVATFVLILSVSAQAQTDPSALPDLTGQEKSTSEISVVLDGRMTTLKVEVWYVTDWQNLKRYWINIINNEAGRPWLALHQVEIGERLPDGGVETKETHRYLLEHVGDKWVLIADFSASQDAQKDLNELLKDKYKFEFGQ